MNETYGKVISYMIAVVELFIVPIVIISLIINMSMQTYISNATQKFVNQCCQTGYIDINNYTTFAENIYRAGADNIKITCSKKIAFNSEATGEFFYDYIDDSTEDIMETLFGKEDGTGGGERYEMRVQDLLTVTVIGGGNHIGDNLLNWITGRSDNSPATFTTFTGTSSDPVTFG